MLFSICEKYFPSGFSVFRGADSIVVKIYV